MDSLRPLIAAGASDPDDIMSKDGLRAPRLLRKPPTFPQIYQQLQYGDSAIVVATQERKSCRVPPASRTPR